MNAAQYMALSILQANKIRELYEDYSLDGKSDEIHLEDLIDVISQYVEMKIEIEEVDWGARRFLGTIRRYDDYAKIYVGGHGEKGEPGKLTRCEQRFIVTKEMGHLVVDSPDNFTTHAASLIKELCDPVLANLDGHQQLQSEYGTKIFATEALFPYSRRKHHIEKIKKGELTTLEVAKHFMVPEQEVFRVMHPDYEKSCDIIYGFL